MSDTDGALNLAPGLIRLMAFGDFNRLISERGQLMYTAVLLPDNLAYIPTSTR